MAPVELVAGVVPVFELILREDAGIASPHVRRPAHLEAVRERDVGRAVDREPALRVHDDAVVVVVQNMLVAILGLEQRCGDRFERVTQHRKRDPVRGLAEEVGVVALALRVVLVEWRVEARDRLRGLLEQRRVGSADALRALARGHGDGPDLTVGLHLQPDFEGDGNRAGVDHRSLPRKGG